MIPKICVPLQYKSEGGMYSFLRNFLQYLRDRDIPHTDNPEDSFDILFTFSFKLTYDQIFKIKNARPNMRVVHRVDGASQDYGRLDNSDEILSRANLLADLTIFQSQYARYSTRQKFHVISKDGPVIYNPVDTKLFRPEGEKMLFLRARNVCYASFSMNPMKGAAEVYEIAAGCPDVGFVLCGRFENPPPIPNLRILGCLTHEDLSKVYRSCDAFFFPSKNEACPNVVLEALASGLPVLYKDSGASGELVGDCGFSVTSRNFRDRLDALVAGRVALSAHARQRALKLFSPDVVFPQYLEAMTRILRPSNVLSNAE